MRWLIITLSVLVVLLVGADVGGRALAESKAGEAIANQAHSQVAPKVDIHGFSFLAQALPGNYDKITVSSPDLDLGPLKQVDTVVDLYDVHFPASDAISGKTDNLTAGRAELWAEVPADSLKDALHLPSLTVSPAAGDSLKISTTLTVAGLAIPVSATVSLNFSAGLLNLSASQIEGAGVALPVPPDQLARLLSISVPIDDLPVPVTDAAVSADGDEVVITATAVDISANSLR